MNTIKNKVDNIYLIISNIHGVAKHTYNLPDFQIGDLEIQIRQIKRELDFINSELESMKVQAFKIANQL